MGGGNTTKPKTSISLTRKIVFSLVISLFTIISLELALRVAGFYYNPHDLNQPLFVQNKPGTWSTNQHYLHHEMMKLVRVTDAGVVDLNLVNDQSFPVTKAPNTIRLILIGGSTVHDWGKADSVKQGLEQALHTKIEVINMGVPGCSSEREVITAREAIRIGADFAVYYPGHNEFLNLSSADGHLVLPLGLRPYYKNSRLAQFSWWLSRKAKPPTDFGAFFGLDQAVSVTDMLVDLKPCKSYFPEERDRVYQRLESNIATIIKDLQAANVGIALCTAPYNLSLPPWSAASPANLESLSDEQLQFILNDNGVAASAAGTILAHRAREKGEIARARQLYESSLLACARPQRADRRTNEIIRRLAATYAVPIIPIKEAIEAASKDGISDSTLFADQCHMTSNGHSIVFTELTKRLTEFLGRAQSKTAAMPHLPNNIAARSTVHGAFQIAEGSIR